MKIGIVTFHQSLNYGAILQTYALQMYLERLGNNVEIIDYANPTFRFFQFLPTTWKTAESKISNIFFAKAFLDFRKKHLRLNAHRYTHLKELKRYPPSFDAYVCGSDQIWNHIFINGRYGFESAYFLDFGSHETKRIAYAASFSTSDLPEALKDPIRDLLSRFCAISVRDRGGLELLSQLGIDDAQWLPDPTLLLSEVDYEQVLKVGKISSNYLFAYNLNRQSAFENCLEALAERQPVIYSHRTSVLPSKAAISARKRIKHVRPSPGAWLGYIRNSAFVLTDSFHGTVFAIIFKKPFITVLVDGKLSGGNDRLISLLERLGLQDRVIKTFDVDVVDALANREIDWLNVERRIADWRLDSERFLTAALKNT